MTHATRRSRLLLATATLLALAVPAVPATGAVPIPPGPLDSTVPQFEGRAATPRPRASRTSESVFGSSTALASNQSPGLILTSCMIRSSARSRSWLSAPTVPNL